MSVRVLCIAASGVEHSLILVVEPGFGNILTVAGKRALMPGFLREGKVSVRHPSSICLWVILQVSEP